MYIWDQKWMFFVRVYRIIDVHILLLLPRSFYDRFDYFVY